LAIIKYTQEIHINDYSQVMVQVQASPTMAADAQIIQQRHGGSGNTSMGSVGQSTLFF